MWKQISFLCSIGIRNVKLKLTMCIAEIYIGGDTVTRCWWYEHLLYHPISRPHQVSCYIILGLWPICHDHGTVMRIWRASKKTTVEILFASFYFWFEVVFADNTYLWLFKSKFISLPTNQANFSEMVWLKFVFIIMTENHEKVI